MLEEINQIKDGKKEKHVQKSERIRVKINFHVSVQFSINPLKWLMGMDIPSTPKILKIYNKSFNPECEQHLCEICIYGFFLFSFFSLKIYLL